MARCIGAVVFDHWFRDGRMRCSRETGASDILLCAGCRVIQTLEDKKRKKIARRGLAQVFDALSRATPPKTRSEERELEDSETEGDS